MAPGFCPTGEVLKSGVSGCVVVHSPLRLPQYLSKLCFTVPLRLPVNKWVWGQSIVVICLAAGWVGIPVA